jgi:20S proteasome alpha/beta subunit
MTLIIGKRCLNGVILAADRRELRGLEPKEQCKINYINFEANSAKASALLAGAGVAAFWDEVAWSMEQYLITEADQKSKTFLDIVSGISSGATNLSTRYQRGGMDERLGCVVAGLNNLNSGKAKLYYFAGAGFSETQFICLGSGDAYALPLADVLLNTKDITTDEAIAFLPLIFLMVERVNVSVAGGPDIFIVKDDNEQPVCIEKENIDESRTRVSYLIKKLPDVIGQVTNTYKS